MRTESPVPWNGHSETEVSVLRDAQYLTRNRDSGTSKTERSP